MATKQRAGDATTTGTTGTTGPTAEAREATPTAPTTRATAKPRPRPRPRRRRRHHEGSVRYREKERRWEGILSTGAGTRKSVYGRTQAEVQRKMREAQRDLERGVPLADERQTVASYLRLWLDTLSSTRLKPSTILRHRELATLHIIPHIGAVRLARLTAMQVQALYADCLKDGLSTTTVHHLHATLHKALANAVRLDMIPRNVCDLVEPPRVRRSEMRVWTQEQVRAFLASVKAGTTTTTTSATTNAISDAPDYALYVLALSTGMRKGELLGLRWRDINMQARKINVQNTLQREKGQQGAWRWDEPKTRRSRRQISVQPLTIEALREHRKRQREMRLLAGAAWKEYDLVFTNATGEPLWEFTVYHRFVKACERAGVPRIRFHDLRHTCATHLLAGGAQVKVVSEMLGHASSSFTNDVYAHVLPDMQQDAAGILETVLFGG